MRPRRGEPGQPPKARALSGARSPPCSHSLPCPTEGLPWIGLLRHCSMGTAVFVAQRRLHLRVCAGGDCSLERRPSRAGGLYQGCAAPAPPLLGPACAPLAAAAPAHRRHARVPHVSSEKGGDRRVVCSPRCCAGPGMAALPWAAGVLRGPRVQVIRCALPPLPPLSTLLTPPPVARPAGRMIGSGCFTGYARAATMHPMSRRLRPPSPPCFRCAAHPSASLWSRHSPRCVSID